MMLDIDDLENEFEVLEIKNVAKQCPYTWMTFVSPSGIGLKIWVKVANTDFEHSTAYQKLLVLYENFLRVPVDKSTTDLARACFISYDSNFHLNEKSDIFDFKTAKLLNSPRQINAKYMENTIKFCIEFTQRVVEFEEGNRNNFIDVYKRQVVGKPQNHEGSPVCHLFCKKVHSQKQHTSRIPSFSLALAPIIAKGK